MNPSAVTRSDELAAVTPPKPAPVSIELGLAPHSDDNLYAGFDGVEGVFVATWESVPLGTWVALTLHFPGGATVAAPGIVAWTRAGVFGASPGLGVRFVEPLPTAQQELLDIFAAFRPPLFYG